MTGASGIPVAHLSQASRPSVARGRSTVNELRQAGGVKTFTAEGAEECRGKSPALPRRNSAPSAVSFRPARSLAVAAPIAPSHRRRGTGAYIKGEGGTVPPLPARKEHPDEEPRNRRGAVRRLLL